MQDRKTWDQIAGVKSAEPSSMEHQMHNHLLPVRSYVFLFIHL